MEKINRYPRILVTGGFGFIGSHLVRKLVSSGLTVGVIETETASEWRVTDVVNKLQVYRVDLKNTGDVATAVNEFNPDCVVHLAAYYTVDHKPEEIKVLVDANLAGTINLADAITCRPAGKQVKLFINTSTCFVYKETEEKLAETAELGPLNLYAATKLQAEQACEYYARKNGVKTVNLRLFPPYGPCDVPRKLIPHVIKSLSSGQELKFSSGKQQWDYVYVTDIVDAYCRVLASDKLMSGYDTFNIGTGTAVSIKEIVMKIRQLLNSDVNIAWDVVPHRKSELWYTCADTTKARTVLGWEAETRMLETGLAKSVEWWLKYFQEAVK
jgi:nucleoside-diphosphate-sugar epimerase